MLYRLKFLKCGTDNFVYYDIATNKDIYVDNVELLWKAFTARV